MQKSIRIFLFILLFLPGRIEGNELTGPHRGNERTGLNGGNEQTAPVGRGGNRGGVTPAGVVTPDKRSVSSKEAPPQGGTQANGNVSLPVSISSEKMTVKGLEDKVLFNGTVLIQRGDITIKAGRAEVLLSDLGKDPKKGVALSSSIREGKEITRIEVTQNVELTQGNRRVAAQRGIYDAKREEIFFTGEPEMWEEGYHVKGKAITLSLINKRSFVEKSQLTIK